MSLPEDEEPTTKVEILYENQRGLWICGTPHFSYKMLNPFDNPPWTDEYQRFSPVDIHSAQLPDPSWVWADPYWHIDMSGDVDEDGWEYAFIFQCQSWHGDFRFFRSFVRRRRWIRHRKYKDRKPTFAEQQMIYPLKDGAEDDEAQEPAPAKSEDIIARLEECRIDRERFVVIKDYFQSCGESELRSKIHEILCALNYSYSRTRFLSMVNQHYPEIDTSDYLSQLDFYSDYKTATKTLPQHTHATASPPSCL
ncbi:hypothetical protein K493DRAFT_316900 [Basidiobolus meristosporus CBS 931.73]|uniref:Peroxin/Ferlin domain-containing protein n=1 Tax=Basidiobolus meristosporus CBS 931.73 TaxID=1314790 RepID=A0A1Y1Y1J4_9FUNG|nr:hypothetical protein K493DRAFT_316900 [Basidiobolus meristosporus CBS 931.73]|eukprot:ORX91877.1 hypothetical protein K493DRAFT_316900 [Basidiobolus meristosporus CBS 931.73]